MNDTVIPRSETQPEPESYNASRRWLFTLTILTGSFLLFLVQPLVARMAMPRLGGAPAVWNSAQLVYQALLLGGYAYAHWLSQRLPRQQAMIHIGLFLVAALWLPVGLIAGNPPANSSVVLFVPWLLAASIGPLFLAVAAQAPLMQRWFHFHAPHADPYPLYAASNFGSFAGLLAYPLVVEPLLGSSAQSWLWSGIYGLLFLLMAACAYTIYRDRSAVVAEDVTAAAAMDEAPPTLVRKLKWIALAAVPSGLMLSTTTHLTTDMMAVPLLWVIPLGIYLLSFSVAFAERRGLARLILFLSPFLIMTLGGTALVSATRSPVLLMAASLVLLFIVAVALHTMMYEDRPSPKYLTQFYLLMSVGGVIGGIFCALLAPVLFNWVYEHPLLILAAGALVPQQALIPVIHRLGLPLRIAHLVQWVIAGAILGGAIRYLYHNGSPPDTQFGIAVVVLLVIGIWMTGNRIAFLIMLLATMAVADGWNKVQPRLEGLRTRSYFGVYTVYPDHGDKLQKLVNGTTLHGLQHLDPARATEPTSYYGTSSGVGIVLSRAPRVYPNARVGIVGLGAGTLACYRQADQDWHLYEIDPVMVDIAKDPKNFSFLSRCAPDAKIHVGDARLTLADQPAQSLDVLVIDAFSSDAIPMHLLTREAFQVYRRVLSPKGVLVVHISNRYFDLEPVLEAEARKDGWATAARWDSPDPGDAALTASTWVAMAADETLLDNATGYAAGQPYEWSALRDDKPFRGWTDDYGSVLPLVKFWKKEGE